jgi:hypothetical protein
LRSRRRACQNAGDNQFANVSFAHCILSLGIGMRIPNRVAAKITPAYTNLILLNKLLRYKKMCKKIDTPLQA